jgi:hypothetical protein
MKTEIKSRITQKEYAGQQIQKYLEEAVAYSTQVLAITKTLENKDKKEAAMKALVAIQEQLKAGEETLKVWKDVYNELEKKEEK